MNETRDFNQDRLVLARQRRGWTKKSLADRAGLSSKIISLYESGESIPTDESLGVIAHELGFPTQFFFGSDIDAPSEENASFRSFSRMTAAQRNAALAAGGLAFLLSDWIDRNFELPAVSVPDCSGMDPEMAAAVVRAEWNLGAGPIKNMIHALEYHGVRVFSLAEETKEVNAFSCWRQGITPFVFLNTQKSAEASRFDAAHELGHLVLHRHGDNKGKEVENEANAFASAFLMPKDSVEAHSWHCRTVPEIIRGKKLWNVSAMAFAFRLHKVGILTEWLYRSVCIELSTMGARSREMDPGPREVSQILVKVLGFSRDQGTTLYKIADELLVTVDDLVPLLFGLVPIAMPAEQEIKQSLTRNANLRLVKG